MFLDVIRRHLIIRIGSIRGPLMHNNEDEDEDGASDVAPNEDDQADSSKMFGSGDYWANTANSPNAENPQPNGEKDDADPVAVNESAYSPPKATHGICRLYFTFRTMSKLVRENVGPTNAPPHSLLSATFANELQRFGYRADIGVGR